MDDAVGRWVGPGAVIAGAVGLPFAVWAVLEVPDWVVLVALAASLAGAVVVVRQIAYQREQRELRAAAAVQQQAKAAAAKPPEPPPREEHHVPAIPVDSAEPFYRFVLSCTVCWRSEGGQHTNPRGLAVHAVLERARQVTVQSPPTEAEATAVRLGAELGHPLPDRSGQVLVWAEDVALGLPAEDAERLKRLSEVRKEKQIREQERDIEQAARAYLKDEVLADPGRAVVWWLARHPDQVREAAELLPTFTQLSAAAHGVQAVPGADQARAERVRRPEIEEGQ